MVRARRDRPAEIGPCTLDELLGADVGDGLMIDGRTYAIASVGRSQGADGFETREFTLGEDEDFYLVVEGQLASGDPDRCRGVLTHELNVGEVHCPTGAGRRQLAASVLKKTDDAPAEVDYQGRRYKFLRRVDAHSGDAKRQCDRVSWDYEFGRRNLAIERWPGGEMAVYEGRVVPLDRIRVVPDYQSPTSSIGSTAPQLPAELGLLAGILMIILGWVMLFL